jgi:branched-chain amino acid transport system substrate-binding protein
MTAGDSDDPQVQAYLQALEQSYGKEIAGTGPSVFTYGYYTAGRALVEGLNGVRGDISDQKRLQQQLANVKLEGAEAPYGDVQLDENRQAISNVFVKRIVRDQNGDDVPDVQTFRRIPNVDQTFGGFFGADSAAPDRNNPKCEKADPPPWVGRAEQVNAGA